MSVTVLNTDAGLSGKTLVNAEDNQTVTGLKTYDRDPNPPFAVSAGSAVVTNLDADKVDGLEASVFARWDGTGTPLGKIAFPATQSASADANTLDDYEEGTWTPVIGGTGGASAHTYVTQAGRYVKVGKLVHCQVNVSLSSLASITGTVQITGLPFTSANSAARSTVLFGYFANMTTNWIWLTGVVDSNATTATIYGRASAGTTVTGIAHGDLAANTDWVLSFSYEASA